MQKWSRNCHFAGYKLLQLQYFIWRHFAHSTLSAVFSRHFRIKFSWIPKETTKDFQIAEVFIRRFSAVVAKINMNKIRGKMGNKNKNQWEFSEKKAGKKSTKI